MAKQNIYHRIKDQYQKTKQNCNWFTNAKYLKKIQKQNRSKHINYRNCMNIIVFV